MKIIKEGDLSRIKDLWWYHAVCPRCGCEFEFHWDEAEHYYGYDIASHSVKCPTCCDYIKLRSDSVKEIKP